MRSCTRILRVLAIVLIAQIGVPASSGGTSNFNSPTNPSATYTSPAGRTFTGLSNSPTYSRGPSSVYRPASTYLHAPYNGPMQIAASGAYVPKAALTSQYPRNGARCAISAAAAGGAAGVYVASNRPYVHMYPAGYTIICIPYYSPVYVRTYGHWAVYNEQGIFYDFDDGDATDDFYDYDSADGLPAGCEHPAQ
ncbi:hypothetical protein WJX75_005657 [Coccomyxa subellipsoidea]|uniref:OCRE domain-containing protein n=1 Tax=Coccomyxa subellipsoidea TaxID=248742 RepID=A0ABR2YD91_9CHLO